MPMMISGYDRFLRDQEAYYLNGRDYGYDEDLAITIARAGLPIAMYNSGEGYEMVVNPGNNEDLEHNYYNIIKCYDGNYTIEPRYGDEIMVHRDDLVLKLQEVYKWKH